MRSRESYNPHNHPQVMIRLESISKVKNFVNIAARQDFEMDIASLTTQHVIDGKSIMGIFSLNLEADVALVVHTSSENALKFFDEIQDFVVNA